MAIQLRDTIRNGRLDSIETVGGASCSLRLYTGAQPADVIQANSGTLLVTINLPADWLANAAAGAKAIAGSWSGAATLGAVTLSGTGAVPVAGAGAATLGEVTLVGTGTVSTPGGGGATVMMFFGGD